MTKNRRGDPESPMNANGPLPSGWAWASVEDLLVEPTCNGISIKGSDTPPGEPALRLSAMSGRGFDYTERRYIPISPEIAEELAVKEGDLYVSRGNGSLRLLGRSTLAQEPPERIVFPDTMIRLRIGGGPTVAKYINYLWESQVVRSQIESKARTTAGIYKISQPDVRAFALPIPPAGEQRRIVAKIEELFSELDAGVAALERVRAGLKRYRASVLKAAVEGKLTEDWRAQHPDTEPASILLERILTERRRKWEEAQLAEFEQATKKPPKAWQGRYRAPDGVTDRELPILPKRWTWATVDQLADVGTGTTPLRSNEDYYRDGSIPWVTSTAVNLPVVHSATEFVTERALDETTLRLYSPQTLIIALYGEGKTRGKVSELAIEATINRACSQ